MGLIRSVLISTQTDYVPSSPPPPPPPAAPSTPTGNGLATTSATALAQSWTDASSDETGFTAQIATNSSFTTGLQTDSSLAAGATSKNWTGLDEGTRYYCRVRADKTGADSSSWSSTANAYTQLATPTNFSAVLSGGVVTFTWTDNSDNESEYQMQKDSSDEGSPLSANTEQYQESEGSAAGTWRVYAKASGIPDSDFSGTAGGPPWPE